MTTLLDLDNIIHYYPLSSRKFARVKPQMASQASNQRFRWRLRCQPFLARQTTLVQERERTSATLQRQLFSITRLLCRFLGPNSHRCDWPSVLQCFGATAERQGWNRPKDLPFVEPSSFQVPGPGSYGAAKSTFRMQLQKRLTDDPIAFSSTDMRPCLKHGVSAQNSGTHSAPQISRDPGPGDYNLANQSIVNVIRKKTFGRHGIFGTCTTRFNRHCLPPDVARLHQYHNEVDYSAPNTPGPGAYGLESPVLQHDLACQSRPKPKPQPAYSFRSSVERLGARKYDTRAPDVLQVGSQKTPSVGSNPASFLMKLRLAFLCCCR